MEWAEIKWDITASADLETGRYLLYNYKINSCISASRS